MRWTWDPAACGHHAEKVVLASIRRAAGEGQFLVPNQRMGHIPRVWDLEVTPGPLDALAFIPDMKNLAKRPVPMVIEVKNVHDWIYAWDRRLWELLIKAANLARHIRVFPVLACPHSDITAYRMGIDVGFSRARYYTQLFTNDEEKIPASMFDEVREEFGLSMTQCAADRALQDVVQFMVADPRKSLGSSAGGRPWYEVAADRCQHLSPTILRFDSLAGDLSPTDRGNVHRAFEAAARSVATWTWLGGWSLRQSGHQAGSRGLTVDGLSGQAGAHPP